MKRRARTALLLGLLMLAAPALWGQRNQVQRTADGKPDFSGTYDVGTLTPLERPQAFGDRLFLSREEADELAAQEQEFAAEANRGTDPNREAPPVGGAAGVGFEERRQEGELLGAGNVGGYNWLWVDRGGEALEIDGQFRTSIITDPAHGRMPPMVPEVAQSFQATFSSFLRNDGTAWWLDQGDGSGPYDDIEDRPLYERCLLGFSGGPPMVPSLYNNYVRVVQTNDTLMIQNEMIHDARIVRLGGEPAADEMRNWLGDSIGRWEGDTLVIETQNFRDQTGLFGGSENLRLTERLSPLDGDRVHYSFTVDDPTVWTAPWSGDYVWPKSENKIYEYACHEGNHSMIGIMKGARLLESEHQKVEASGDSGE